MVSTRPMVHAVIVIRYTPGIRKRPLTTSPQHRHHGHPPARNTQRRHAKDAIRSDGTHRTVRKHGLNGPNGALPGCAVDESSRLFERQRTLGRPRASQTMDKGAIGIVRHGFHGVSLPRRRKLVQCRGRRAGSANLIRNAECVSCVRSESAMKRRRILRKTHTPVAVCKILSHRGAACGQATGRQGGGGGAQDHV